jgi:hypothetical protein
MCVGRGFRDGGRTGTAWSHDAAGPDRTAFAFARRELRADAALAAFRHGGSGGDDHWSAG